MGWHTPRGPRQKPGPQRSATRVTRLLFGALCCTGMPATAAPAKPSAKVAAKSNVFVIP
jgi:hypothetical protein